jgi:hypothetical protein
VMWPRGVQGSQSRIEIAEVLVVLDKVFLLEEVPEAENLFVETCGLCRCLRQGQYTEAFGWEAWNSGEPYILEPLLEARMRCGLSASISAPHLHTFFLIVLFLADPPNLRRELIRPRSRDLG